MFFTICLHSCLLTAQSTWSHRGIGGGIQIPETVASSPSSSLPVARAPQRACLQAKPNATSRESDRGENWLKNTKQALSEKELNKEDTLPWVALKFFSPTSYHYFQSLPRMLTCSPWLPMLFVSSVRPSSAWIPSKSLLLWLISPCLLWERQLVVHMMKIALWSCWEHYTLRWLSLMHLASGFLEMGGQRCWQMHQHPSMVVADSFLSASHITSTRWAHQVTAVCLHILMKKAYAEFRTADLVTCLSPAYNQPVFAPHILRQLESVKRLEIGWSVYTDHSLKKTASEKQGSRQWRKVLLTSRIMSDWKGFLRVDNNKGELFKLLAIWF